MANVREIAYITFVNIQSAKLFCISFTKRFWCILHKYTFLLGTIKKTKILFSQACKRKRDVNTEHLWIAVAIVTLSIERFNIFVKQLIQNEITVETKIKPRIYDLTN